MPFAWPAVPPEIAEALLSGGDKAVTTADAGAAHGALTGMMGADGVSMTVNAGGTAPMFQGLGASRPSPQQASTRRWRRWLRAGSPKARR
ncbi:hypothetical protein [Mycobacteroides abscessus]|uniref:hypothetical protein n=1 Tax=Mycobacteroides abscessus TaxID=36809 RepID=UPI001300DD64|nr:hypothetical protein [Mycobacteroides abscessus]